MYLVSLHYLMKLEMLIGHVLPLSFYRKNLQSSYHTSTVAPKCMASMITPDD